MADPRFYPDARPISAKAIAALVRGDLITGKGDVMATEVATPDAVKPGTISFVSKPKVIATMPACEGHIVLVLPDLASTILEGATVITTPDPKSALGLVLREMYPAETSEGGIHPSAVVDPSARIGDGVSIGAAAVIEVGVEIGNNAVIASGALISRGCVLSDGVSIGANAVISYAVIGENTRIGPMAHVGNAGFGILRDGKNYVVNHIGRVLIGRNCYIAGLGSIDRGFLGDTVIGDAVMIDSMVHIAHNVHVGDGTIICGMVGIAGSTRIGRNNVFAATAGVADNITIGDGNMFAARSGVTNRIGDGQVMGGYPAVPINQHRRQVIALRRLAKSISKGDKNG